MNGGRRHQTQTASGCAVHAPPDGRAECGTSCLSSRDNDDLGLIYHNARYYLPDAAAERIVHNLNDFCSFSADTAVLTDVGLVPIAEVGPGRSTWEYNEATGEFGFYPILALWAHEDDIIVHLTIDGATLKTTPDHPFMTAAGAWMPAAALQPGDQVRIDPCLLTFEIERMARWFEEIKSDYEKAKPTLP